MNKPLSWLTPMLALVLGFALLRLGLPVTPVAAASPAPTTTPKSVLSQPACDTKRNVQVTGTAVINVAPDRALIQLGVQS
ncbi:MAG: hypothetical protein ACM3MF_01130, partial [Anaerolineae bacterium]